MGAPRDEEGRAKAADALARGLGITAAAEAAGFARPAMSRLANHDPAFQQQVEARRAELAAQAAAERAKQPVQAVPDRVSDAELEKLERAALVQLAKHAERQPDCALQLVRAVDIITRRRAGKKPAEDAPPVVAQPPKLKAMAGGWV